jgi:hypothetical protein
MTSQAISDLWASQAHWASLPLVQLVKGWCTSMQDGMDDKGKDWGVPWGHQVPQKDTPLLCKGAQVMVNTPLGPKFVPQLSQVKYVEKWIQLSSTIHVPSPVLRGLQEGVRLQLWAWPVSAWFSNHPSANDNQELVDKTISSWLLSKRVVVWDPKWGTPHIIAPLQVEVDFSGKARLISDCRYLTAAEAKADTTLMYIDYFLSLLVPDSSPSHGSSSWSSLMSQGDLSSGFQQLSYHSSSWCLVGISWRGVIMAHKVLVWGDGRSPGVFSQFTCTMGKAVDHALGRPSSSVWIDDFNFCVRNQQESNLAFDTVEGLGAIWGVDKCQFEAGKLLQPIGYHVDLLGDGVLSAKPSRLSKMAVGFSKLKEIQGEEIPARILAKLIGMLVSLVKVFPAAQPLLRPVNTASLAHIVQRHQWYRKISLPPPHRARLEWLYKLVQSSPPTMPIRPHGQVFFHWDACDYGVGGILWQQGKILAEAWLELPPDLKQSHITYKELLAAPLLLKHFSPLITNETLTCLSDNMAAVKSLKKGSKKFPRQALVEHFWFLALSQGVKVYNICHIHGYTNVLADRASRKLGQGCSCHPKDQGQKLLHELHDVIHLPPLPLPSLPLFPPIGASP